MTNPFPSRMTGTDVARVIGQIFEDDELPSSSSCVGHLALVFHTRGQQRVRCRPPAGDGRRYLTSAFWSHSLTTRCRMTKASTSDHIFGDHMFDALLEASGVRFCTSDSQSWIVGEHSAARTHVLRVVWAYPADWVSLSPAELEALSWKR